MFQKPKMLNIEVDYIFEKRPSSNTPYFHLKIQNLVLQKSYKNTFPPPSLIGVFSVFLFLSTAKCYGVPNESLLEQTNEEGNDPFGVGSGLRPRASSARHWSKHRIRRNRWRHPAAPKNTGRFGIQNVLGQSSCNFGFTGFTPQKTFSWIWRNLKWFSGDEFQIPVTEFVGICGNWQFVQRTRIKYITLQNSPKLGMIMGSGKVLHLCSGKASESVSSTLATCFLLGFCTAKKKPLGMILGICRSRQPGYPWNKETFLPLLNHLLVWCSAMQSKSHPTNKYMMHKSLNHCVTPHN